MAKYIISTDNCSDLFKSDMDKRGFYSIPLKYIIDGKEYAKVFDSLAEFDEFYDHVVKKGALPTTSQINPEEFIAHFNKILSEQKNGDIIHVSMDGALSGSHNSAVVAAEELNKTLQGRKIYAVDSLHVSAGITMLLEKLEELKETTDAADAVKVVEDMRGNVNVFFIVDDLAHLRRGGRLSTMKMIIGQMLGIKPILIVNDKGKVASCSKARGTDKALSYILDQTQAQADVEGQDYSERTLYVLRTTESPQYETLKKQAREKYPNGKISEVKIGPIIGTHIGPGAVGVFFMGKPRLDVQ